MKLIDELHEGRVDIIGDVHGEITALERLLEVLGYDDPDNLPADRRLVFVGDLVDRGPDNIAVVERVQALVEAGRAQCVLGNHELNILMDDPKHGNEWFFGHGDHNATPSRSPTEEQRRAIVRFFHSLPLVLEREDLRVVHACWNQEAVARIQADEQQAVSVADLQRSYNAEIRKKLQASDHVKRHAEEEQRCGRYIRFDHADPAEYWPRPVMLDAHAYEDEIWQMQNPIRVLTSGEERKAKEVFAAGGKFRFLERLPWWKHYEDNAAVIVGHYWRRYHSSGASVPGRFGPDLLDGIEPQHWMGKKNNVYCVDFSVGARATARIDGKPEDHHKLAALRWPEKEVVFDDGETRQTI